jgi:hypothetical protein
VPGCPDKFTETGTYQDFRTSGPVGEVSTADPLGGAPFEPVSNSITYGNQGNDAISTASAVSSGTDVCFAGSDGDDILIQRSFAPNELSTAYFSGGDGADMFAIGYSLGELGSAISVTTITDFEPSVDTLAISPDMVGAGEVSEASVQFINGFDGTSAPLGRNIIVDTTDGEVWVADPSDGSTLIVLLSDAPVITEDDIVFVPPAV